MTIQTMQRYLHATKAHLAFISETKCDTAKALDRVIHLPLPNFEIIHSAGKSGSLWLLWADNINITNLERSFYFIFVRVENVLGS